MTQKRTYFYAEGIALAKRVLLKIKEKLMESVIGGGRG